MIVRDFLCNLDGGIHTSEDLNKKLCGSYILGRPEHFANNIPIWIHSIGGDGLVYWKPANKAGANQNTSTEPLNSFWVEMLRPFVGIYNVGYRPLQYLQFPKRQWRVGYNPENSVLKDVKGNFIPIESSVNNLDSLLTPSPTYPTLDAALKMLREKKVKHIAINSSITIMQGKERQIFFKNFVPFMIKKGAFVFKSPVTSHGLEAEFNEYKTLIQRK